MKKLVFIYCDCRRSSPSGAVAQQADGTNAATGMVGGAATGAILRRPDRAGSAGVGAARRRRTHAAPPEVVTYVQQQRHRHRSSFSSRSRSASLFPKRFADAVPQNPTYDMRWS